MVDLREVLNSKSKPSKPSNSQTNTKTKNTSNSKKPVYNSIKKISSPIKTKKTKNGIQKSGNVKNNKNHNITVTIENDQYKVQPVILSRTSPLNVEARPIPISHSGDVRYVVPRSTLYAAPISSHSSVRCYFRKKLNLYRDL